MRVVVSWKIVVPIFFRSYPNQKDSNNQVSFGFVSNSQNTSRVTAAWGWRSEKTGSMAAGPLPKFQRESLSLTRLLEAEPPWFSHFCHNGFKLPFRPVWEVGPSAHVRLSTVVRLFYIRILKIGNGPKTNICSEYYAKYGETLFWVHFMVEISVAS